MLQQSAQPSKLLIMEALLTQYKDFQVAILESWWVVEVVTFVENCFLM